MIVKSKFTALFFRPRGIFLTEPHKEKPLKGDEKMVQEHTEQRQLGLFQALEAVSGRLRSLAVVMQRMNGFELGEKITLNQNQVDIVFRKLTRH